VEREGKGRKDREREEGKKRKGEGIGPLHDFQHVVAPVTVSWKAETELDSFPSRRVDCLRMTAWLVM